MHTTITMFRMPYPHCRVLFLLPLLLAVLLGTGSCRKLPEPVFDAGGGLRKLAEPIQLEKDTTRIDLTTFFIPRSLAMIDSVTGTDRLAFSLSKEDGKLTVIPRSSFIPHLSEMTVWMSGTPYSVMLRRPLFERFSFSFDPEDQGYRRVSLTGEMNNWNPRTTPLHLIDGVWQTTLALESGSYRYRIVADGREMPDPNNPLTAGDGEEAISSVLVIGKPNPNAIPVFSGYTCQRYRVTVEVKNHVEEVFVFWQNFRLPADYVAIHHNSIQIGVPGDALDHRESVLRVWAYNEHGPSGDLAITLEKGRPVCEN